MIVSANWCAKVGITLFALAIVVAAIGCGGSGGGSLGLDPSSNGSGAGASAAVKSAGVLVTEAEIPSLPAWQQELLSDPGWNQPYIEPVPGTEIEAPTDELLRELTERELAKGLQMAPRLFDEGSSSKGVSWNDQGNFNESMSVSRAEYESYNGTGTPPWGCNVNTTNDYNTKNKASEDAILGYDYAGPPQRISFVLRGTAANNWFTSGSSTGNNATNCVYQLYSSDEGADPTDPNSTAMFAEVSYRADKAIDPGTGLPGEPGGECPDAEAFMVDGLFWKKFNSTFSALPNYAQTALYNILIAPQSDESDEEKSSGDTMGSYQEFYLGSQTLYNGAWIVGLASSTGGCTEWQDTLGVGAHTGFFHNPIFGVLLARWQDAAMPGMAGPWEGTLGWPVFGPQPLSGGSTLTAHGAYYAWGMWFERGFIWWVDYNQTTNPDTPDEAQMYLYTGSNVYCKDGTYEPTGTLYYGGTGPLAVNVSVDGMRYDGADPWEPVPFNESLSRYEVPLEDDGLDTVTLAMHAQAYGGETDADGKYKYYVWSFRDGTIQAAGPAYSDFNRYVTHTYGSTTQNLEGTYVVRVQVTDASFDNGHSAEEVRAYGDSFPIVIGHGGGSGGPVDVLIIANDGGAYPTNLAAIKADLDQLGIGYFETTDINTDPTAYKAVIWYQGGPDGVTETAANTTFSNADRIWQITAAEVPVLTFAQGLAMSTSSDWFTNLGGTRTSVSLSPYTDWAVNYGYSPIWVSGTGDGSVYFRHQAGLVPGGGWTNNWIGVSTSGENYQGTGTSGYAAMSVDVPATQISYRIAFTSGWMVNFFCVPGIQDGFSAADASSGSWPDVSMSGGCETSNNTWPGGTTDPLVPGHPIKHWHIGYPWATCTFNGVSGEIEKRFMLQNVLMWLDPTITLGGGGPGTGFTEYSGQPEILAVTPMYYDGSGALVKGFTTQTYSAPSGYGGGAYPDQTGTNVYRNTDPGSGNYVYTINPNNDWINGNDVDFQFPWYAYVYDPDDSLSEYDWDGFGAAPAVSGDEVLVGYAGLLIDDPDTIWDRDAIVSFDDTDFVDVAGWSLLTWHNVPGYYVTTTDVVGTPGLDTAEKASYGTDMPALTFDNQYPLIAEALAHWPSSAGLTDLMWAMFPGHGMIDPSTGDEIPWDTGFDVFQETFEIDPSVTVAERDSPPPLATAWNRNNFNALGTTDGGRYVEFNFRNATNWYGDLNGDGVINDLDKFPVRCRQYVAPLPISAGIWPDHMFNPGSEPAGGVLTSDGDYIEGGCYVVDNGLPVFDLVIFDGPGPDPFEAGGFDWVGGDDFTVHLDYGLRWGVGPYTVELDADYDPSAGPSPELSFGLNDPGQVYTVETGSFDMGYRTNDVVVTQPNHQPITTDTYLFALRVTDNIGDSRMFWYGTPVSLKAQVKCAILYDPQSQSTGTTYDLATENLMTDLGYLYGAANVTVIPLTTDLTPGQLDPYHLITWASDRAGTQQTTAPYGYTYGVGNANINEVVDQVQSNGKTLFLAGAGAYGLSRYTSISNVTPLNSTMSWYTGSGYTGAYVFWGGVESIPNSVFGFDSFIDPTLAGVYRNFAYSTVNTATMHRCVMPWYTYDYYVGGAWRDNIGTEGGRCVQFVANYGDMEEFQGSKNGYTNHRGELLENLLCMTDYTSTFNSTFDAWPSPPPPAVTWRQYGLGNSSEYTYDFAMDSAGDFYTLSRTYNHWTSSSYDVLVTKWDSTTKDPVWNHVWNNDNYSDSDYFYDIEVDNANNAIFAVGYNYSPSYSDYGATILKFDLTTGALLWEKQVRTGSTIDDLYTDNLVIDSSGNLYIAGYNGYSNDTGFVFSLDSTGAMRWSKEFSFPSTDVRFRGIETDGTYVYAAGELYRSATFYYDNILVKLDATTGAKVWDRHCGLDASSSSYDYQYGRTPLVDGSGNVYVVGWGDPTTTNTYYNHTITKYDSAGNLQWSQWYGPGTYYFYMYSSTYGDKAYWDSSGNIVTMGYGYASFGSYDCNWIIVNPNTGAIVDQGSVGSSSSDYAYASYWDSVNDLPYFGNYNSSSTPPSYDYSYSWGSYTPSTGSTGFYSYNNVLTESTESFTVADWTGSQTEWNATLTLDTGDGATSDATWIWWNGT